MDISSATLIGFSSVLVVGSLTVIVILNYRRCCKKNDNAPVDWVISNIVMPNP